MLVSVMAKTQNIPVRQQTLLAAHGCSCQKTNRTHSAQNVPQICVPSGLVLSLKTDSGDIFVESAQAYSSAMMVTFLMLLRWSGDMLHRPSLLCTEPLLVVLCRTHGDICTWAWGSLERCIPHSQGR